MNKKLMNKKFKFFKEYKCKEIYDNVPLINICMSMNNLTHMNNVNNFMQDIGGIFENCDNETVQKTISNFIMYGIWLKDNNLIDIDYVKEEDIDKFSDEEGKTKNDVGYLG